MGLDTREGGVLGREEVERFERDGLLVMDDPCPPELIDAVLHDIEPVLRDGSHPWKERTEGDVLFTRFEDPVNERKRAPTGYHWDRVRNAWVFSEPVRELALHPRILSIIEQLNGGAALPFQTLNFPVGTEQAVHFDSMAFESDPPGHMCGVWVALEDMDMDNGPLVYYPGSHKFASPSADRIEELIGESLDKREDFSNDQDFVNRMWVRYADSCQRLIELRDLEPEYATVRKGQAVVWAANLLHGGSAVGDESRTRHSQVTHYFFEGARRVYTPTRTIEGHIFWDYPSWIRDPLPQYSTILVHDTIRKHVPTGAKVLLAVNGKEDELLRADGFEAIPFPAPFADWRDDPTGAERVSELERLRAEGAQFIVFPRTELSALQNFVPELQEHLEDRCSGVLRDGWICAIYALT